MEIEAYRSVINTLSEATILLTGNGQLLALNPPATALLAIKDQSWIEQNLQNFLVSNCEKFAEYLAMCSRSKQSVVGAFSLNTEKGVVDLKTKGAALTPRQGDNDAILILHLFPKLQANVQFAALKERIDELNDQILKRQRVEYNLREQKEWLQVTLASIGDAVIITDKHGLVTFINPTAEKITGWGAKSALGRSLSEIFIVINENTRLPVPNPVEKVFLERRIVNLAAGSVLLSRDGVEFPIADTAAPIYHNNSLEGVVLVFHDVSMKRNLERQLIDRAEKLEEESRQKNLFLAMLAHELRNPLGPISNAIQLLKLDSKIQIALDILERQTNHLAHLVNGLLDISRITEGKISINRERLDLAKLVQLACGDLVSLFERKNIQLQLSMPDEPLFVFADPTRLNQVIGNLLGNAQKFTPQGGRVEVSIKTEYENILLEISDTGPGIDASLNSSLFKPFVQGNQTIERAQGGLGLGLAMVKGIMDLHHGKVFVQNRKSGGAKFTVMLPDIAQTASISKTPNFTKRNHKKILLIEDNQDQANSMCLLLENLGGAVHMAFDGVEGVQMANDLIPDIVICDIGLPLMDGFDVARSLKGNQLTSSSLLIALTGYGQDDFIEKAKLAGFDQHYLKPMNLDVMQKILELEK